VLSGRLISSAALQPSDVDVQRLVRADPANHEVLFGELTSSVLNAKHWLGASGALTLHSTTRGKLFYRFLDAAQYSRARSTLETALRSRLTIA
jgi:hypothetical protein